MYVYKAPQLGHSDLDAASRTCNKTVDCIAYHKYPVYTSAIYWNSLVQYGSVWKNANCTCGWFHTKLFHSMTLRSPISTGTSTVRYASRWATCARSLAIFCRHQQMELAKTSEWWTGQTTKPCTWLSYGAKTVCWHNWEGHEKEQVNVSEKIVAQLKDARCWKKCRSNQIKRRWCSRMPGSIAALALRHISSWHHRLVQSNVYSWLCDVTLHTPKNLGFKIWWSAETVTVHALLEKPLPGALSRHQVQLLDGYTCKWQFPDDSEWLLWGGVDSRTQWTHSERHICGA